MQLSGTLCGTSFGHEWLKIVNVPIDEIDGHAHVIVDINGLLLVDLDRAILIFSCTLVVNLVSEQLRLHRDLRKCTVKLIVRQELIILYVLEKIDSINTVEA